MSLPELQAEFELIQASLETLQEELGWKQSRRRNLEERCDELPAQIDAYRSRRLAAECSKWSSQGFPWRYGLEAVLRDVFQLESFREKQHEVMNAILSGEDVFLVMRSGGGKSLCYLTPALPSKGITLVISPEVSLMVDQFYNLKDRNVRSQYIAEDTTDKSRRWLLKELAVSSSRNLKLMYMLPDMITEQDVVNALLKSYELRRLSRFVIDEAHCASKWGNDFKRASTTLQHQLG